jgi:thiamine biosynthesis lipoprotein
VNDRAEHERTFELFGSEVRILIGQPVDPDAKSPELAALELEAFLRGLHLRLSRFAPASELSRLNADPSDRRRVSPLLSLALRAGLRAAEQTGGLVDPTLTGELERAGYAASRAGVRGASLEEALSWAPPRRPASPRADARWREFRVDADTGVVTRPPGLRFDTGGSGKGLAADLCAGRLADYATFAIDAGGDIRIGGDEPAERVVDVAHPRGDEPAFAFRLVSGAVATSGLRTRLWRTEDGFAHHLLDPSSGEPAWTGVIQATALGATALEAETLAKAALLSGPERGRQILDAIGGLLVLDDGEVVTLGLLADGPGVTSTAKAVA